MNSDCIIEELKYNATDDTIANDDEHIEAHKMFKELWYRWWTLIVQLKSLTSMLMMLLVKKIMHFVTGSCNLIQGQIVCISNNIYALHVIL